MNKDEALQKLVREWKEKGVTGESPTLLDLAEGLARYGMPDPEEEDESPAGLEKEGTALPKAE